MTARELYLDHCATSPMRAEALVAMLPHLRDGCGNPSSVHRAGQRARAVLEDARASIAARLGAAPNDVVFTSGATESNQLALRGVAPSPSRNGLLCSAVEHPSVLECATHSGRTPLVVAPVDTLGVLDVAALEKIDLAPIRVASVQLVNHETGAIQPVETVSQRVRRERVALHCDATQALGRRRVDVDALGVDLLSASSHKIGGPPGIGLLYVRSSVTLEPLFLGGHQERGLRAGTPPVALAVGFAAALAAAEADRDALSARHADLRAWLLGALESEPIAFAINGPADADRAVPGILNLSFPGADREKLLLNLDLLGIRISLGAACASGSVRPSPVLEAMRVPAERLRSALRISFGPKTTMSDLAIFRDALTASLRRSML